MPKLPSKIRNFFKKKKHVTLENEDSPMLDESKQKTKKTNKNLTFNAQLAHGSKTVTVGNFSNIPELYQCLAINLNIDDSDILFCTVNNYAVNMDALLSGQICFDDFIYVHVKGKTKELTINKTELAIGMTITDNGCGKAFIKRIKPNSVASKYSQLLVGDHIVEINNESMLGLRHFEVAKVLKTLRIDVEFTMKLIEVRREFDQIAPRSKPTASLDRVQSGRKSLRLGRKGQAKIQEAHSDFDHKAIEKIDDMFDQYLGIRDSELSTTILESFKSKGGTLLPFSKEVKKNAENTEDFLDDKLLQDIWSMLSDLKVGRI